MEMALARWATGASSAHTFEFRQQKRDKNERRDRKQKRIWSCTLTVGAAAALMRETHVECVLGGEMGQELISRLRVSCFFALVSFDVTFWNPALCTLAFVSVATV